MTDFYFEGHSEGDAEDRSGVSWNELDWKNFLLRQEGEIARFVRLYDSSVAADTERLDSIAQKMGWEPADWSVSDFVDDDLPEDWQEGDEIVEDWDPYTLHRHPVYVVTTGLFFQIRHLWRQSLTSNAVPPNLVATWDFGDALAESERHTLMALQCMDMGDYLLCVVHFKRCLTALNSAMRLLTDLFPCMPEHPNNKEQLLRSAPRLQRDLLQRLFDLREVCLRIIRDCRDEGTGE